MKTKASLSGGASVMATDLEGIGGEILRPWRDNVASVDLYFENMDCLRQTIMQKSRPAAMLRYAKPQLAALSDPLVISKMKM